MLSMPEHDPLVERLKNSDEEAFRLLFEKYQPILFRATLHSTRDTDSAHDIVQETFIRVWNNRRSLQPDLSFIAYLFRISRNLTLDAAKHRAVRQRLEPEISQETSSAYNPETSTELTMLEEKLMNGVRELPPKRREIFVLSRIEGMSNAQISAQLGVSIKTVENQITHALKTLRRHLKI